MGHPDAWLRRGPGRGRSLTHVPATRSSPILERAGRTVRIVHPRDAASLVVYDDRTDPPRFLMGLRGAGHVFMPGHLVFPGGKLEASDVHLASELGRARCRRRHPAGLGVAPLREAALVLAAIRETYEETGLMVFEPARFRSRVPFWGDFAARGVRPASRHLLPMARAVTPESFPRRYDTRFFLVSRDCVTPAAASPPTQEFDRVDWLTTDEAAGFPLLGVTHAVLAQASAWIATGRFDRFQPPLSPLRANVGLPASERTRRWT